MAAGANTSAAAWRVACEIHYSHTGYLAFITHTVCMAPDCCFISYPSGPANYCNGSFFCSHGNPHALPVITLTTQPLEMVEGGKTTAPHSERRKIFLAKQHVVRLRSGTAPRQAVRLKWRSMLNEDNCTGCCVPFFFPPTV